MSNVVEKNFENMSEYIEILKEEIKKPTKFQNANIAFKAMRLALGLTQQEFANLLDTQLKSVSRWENKKNIRPQLTHRQFTTLVYEFSKLGIDVLKLNCFLILSEPYDMKPYFTTSTAIVYA